LSQFQAMLDESIEVALLNFAACLGNQCSCCIFQDNRLQGEAARTFARLDQGASTQAIKGFEQQGSGQGRGQ
jgi:hypothetical protein